MPKCIKNLTRRGEASAFIKQFQFQPFINEALAEKGFEEPTEVQEKLNQSLRKGKVSLDNRKQEVESAYFFTFH